MRTFPASFELVRLEVLEVAKLLVKAIVMKYNFFVNLVRQRHVSGDHDLKCILSLCEVRDLYLFLTVSTFSLSGGEYFVRR